MKSVLLVTALYLTTMMAGYSQSIEGTYANKWESNSGESLEYLLTLMEDGTFTFKSIRGYMNYEPNIILNAKGTWKMNGQLLTLETHDSSDKQNDLLINLDQSKARYVSISPRNPNFNLEKPSFKFYQSDVFYAKDMELYQTDVTVSTTD